MFVITHLTDGAVKIQFAGKKTVTLPLLEARRFSDALSRVVKSKKPRSGKQLEYTLELQEKKAPMRRGKFRVEMEIEGEL